MRTFWNTATIAAALLAAAVLAAPLTASGFGGGHDGRRGGGGPFGGDAILQQAVHPCQASCFTSARACIGPARSTAVQCVSDTCGAQITTARSACTPTSTMQACRNAMSDLHTCGQSCLDTFHSAVATCRDGAQQCKQACGAPS